MNQVLRIPPIPPLEAGDKLTREEFLRRWEAMPGLKRAELIKGIVYMPSPLSLDHGKQDFDVSTWLGVYASSTPGCRGGVNTTWLMLGDSPQPDVYLRILPEYGGKSKVQGSFPQGAPELIVEVCLSSTSYDLHQKLELYQEAKVDEYLAVLIREQEVRWHRLVDGVYFTLPNPPDAIYRSEIFPGLWLHAGALLSGEMPQVLETVAEGIRSPEHTSFVAMLAARKQS